MFGCNFFRAAQLVVEMAYGDETIFNPNSFDCMMIIEVSCIQIYNN